VYTASDIAKLEEVFLAHSHEGVPEFADFLTNQGVAVNLILYPSEKDALHRTGWSNPRVKIIHGGEHNGGQLTTYPRDCGFINGETFFISHVVLNETDYYLGDAYANLPRVINNQLGLQTFVVKFKGGELVSDGNLAIVSRSQDELDGLERKLGIEVIGIDIAKHTDYFFNFVGKNTVLYNSSLANILINSIDKKPYIKSTEKIADELAKNSYQIIEIRRDISKGTRFYPYEYLFTHLTLLGNTFNIDETRVVMIQDFSPLDLFEMNSDDLKGKLSNAGITLLEFPVKGYYQMFSSKGGPRCMTFPVRKTEVNLN